MLADRTCLEEAMLGLLGKIEEKHRIRNPIGISIVHAFGS